MERALLYLLFLFVAGTAAAVLARQARPLAILIISMLLYVPSYMVWFALQYFHIVPVDVLLGQTFDIHSYQLVGTPIGALVLFGPPLLPSMILLTSSWLIRRH